MVNISNHAEAASRQHQQAAALDRKVSGRWTEALAAGGWTPISDAFLENYHRLKVTHCEAMLIVHLMKFKWDDAAPFPGLKRLATQMQLTESSVRRHVQKLEKKKLLRRIPRIGQSNCYDLKPLFIRLEELLRRDEEERVRCLRVTADALQESLAAVG